MHTSGWPLHVCVILPYDRPEHPFMRSGPHHSWALFFKPHFPLTLTFPHDWGQADLLASQPGWGGGASLLKPKAESRESTLCFLSLSYRVLNSPYQVPKSLWMADFYKIKASHLSQMTMRDLREFSLSPVIDDSCRRWWAGGATPNVLWMDAQQPGLKNIQYVWMPRSQSIPPTPSPALPHTHCHCLRANSSLGLQMLFALQMRNASR